jgi:hypothetical protein
MKRILNPITVMILVALFLNSCQPAKFTNRTQEIKTFGIDFRKYAEKGFLFMPDEYYGEYEVKGIITAEIHPEVRYRQGRTPKSNEYIITNFYQDNNSYSQLITHVNIDELIEYVYDLAILWGGDAFTHFKSSFETTRTDESPNTSYDYYTISGIVIKRK